MTSSASSSISILTVSSLHDRWRLYLRFSARREATSNARHDGNVESGDENTERYYLEYPFLFFPDAILSKYVGSTSLVVVQSFTQSTGSFSSPGQFMVLFVRLVENDSLRRRVAPV
ncbi:hypothetical protein QCA50_013199 [Cerrena zonata]|uniref:Uncharacterized protein n=1 Tax=Cerrena zonata TaxID=2478898 RepID=A0AAW0G1N2_9APHY